MEQRLAFEEWWRPEPAAPAEAADAAESRRGLLAFRALLVFTVILVVAPQAFVPALAGLRPALAAAATASLAYVLGRASGRLPVVARAPERLLAGALFAWAVVTIPISFWPSGALQTILNQYIQSLVLFWLIAGTVTSLPRLRGLAWTLAICAVPLALTALKHYAEGVFVQGRVEGYSSGLAGNPNDLALMLVVILPLTLALVGVAKRLVTKVILAAMALLQIAAIVATFSRGGFIALVIVLGGFLLRLIRQRTFAPAVVAVMVLAAGATLLPTGYGARVGTIADYQSDPTGSAQARWSDSLVAIQFIERHPLVGAGVGLDVLALNDVRGATWTHVHDAYLTIGVDLGLLGMGLYVLLLLSSLRTARRAELDADREGLGDVGRLAGGVRIALVAFVFAAFFYPIPYHPYFYLLAGMALAARGILWERAAWEPHDQPSW